MNVKWVGGGKLVTDSEVVDREKVAQRFIISLNGNRSKPPATAAQINTKEL